MSRSFSKVLLAIATTLIATLGFASIASAVPNRPPVPPPTTYWQNKGFMLMAHQGGEWDYPPNTMFAYKSAIANGADVLDMDAWVTSDGHLVLTHDQDVSGRSDAPGGTLVTDTTLAQLKTYDFAYNWSPHDGSATNPFRGVATGGQSPPAGFTADDFKIPTFDEVLDAFPDTPINIELKQTDGLTQPEIEDTAAKMAAILAAHPGHDENVIINSFGQEMLTAMAAARPQHKAYSGSQDGLLAYLTGTPITPTPVALEPPDMYKLSGNWVRTVPILKPSADYDGYKMFVWGSDHDPAQDTPPFYDTLINTEKVDSYNTPDPIALANWLCTNGTPKPDGTPRCSAQVCPEGQTGIAPNNCKKLCPVGSTAEGCPPPPPGQCPQGTSGTPPNCLAPQGELKVLSAKPLSGKKVRAGKAAKWKLTINNSGTGGLTDVKVCASVPKKLRKTIKVPRCSKPVTIAPGASKGVVVAINSTKKAKGKVSVTIKVTSDNGGKASLTVKPVYKPSKCDHLCGKTNHL